MTSTAANVDWRQLAGEDSALEIRMPIILAPTMGSSDVSVTVADSQVVVVKVGGSTIWQCRLYSQIEDEIEWTLENNKSILAMEITKKQGETWPSLLSMTMKLDDSYFLTRAELDDRISRELPCLPPVVAEEPKKEEKEEVVAETKEDGESADKKEEETAEEKKETAEEPAATQEEEKKEEETKPEEETAAAAEEPKEEADGEAATAATEEEAKKEEGETAATTEAESAAEEKKAEEPEVETKEEKAPAPKASSEQDPLDMLDDDDLLNDALDEVIPEKKAAPSTATKDGELEDAPIAEEKKEKAAAVVEEKKKTPEEEEAEKEKAMIEAQIKAELRGIELETEAITEKLEEMIADLAKAEEGSEEKATLTEHVKIASRMLELVRETRNLRSEPATIDNFLKVQIADIQKARVNIGETSPYETEEFQDDMEKTLTGLQLFKAALQYLNQDPATAVHLLRLAAIHHHHAPSVVALFSIYTNVPSSYPRGASLMLQNALRGEGYEVEARTNSRVGDLFNSGTRHFPPIFSLAVHFHQRAAIAGNTHSMVSLAQLFLNGECSGDDTMAPSLKRLNTDEKRANYFLQAAIDRGSIVAYLIRAAQYAQGTEGMPKSMDMAKKYYDRAIAAESSLSSAESKRMRIGTRMTLGDLEKVLNPTVAEVKVTDKTPAATSSSSAAPVRKPAAAKDDDDDIIELRPSSNRNNSGAVTTSAGGARMGYGGAAASGNSQHGGVVAAPAKKNAFVASSNKRKTQWERAARWGIGLYALYALAFPLRLVMLPFFYDKVATVMEFFGIGLAGGSMDNSLSMGL